MVPPGSAAPPVLLPYEAVIPLPTEITNLVLGSVLRAGEVGDQFARLGKGDPRHTDCHALLLET